MTYKKKFNIIIIVFGILFITCTYIFAANIINLNFENPDETDETAILPESFLMLPSKTAPIMRPLTESYENEIIVYVTSSGNKFHKQNCDILNGANISIALSTAKQTRFPCESCMPIF